MVIAGSPDDAEKGQFIENYVKSDNLINLVGQTTMAELIELIRHCHILSALIRAFTYRKRVKETINRVVWYDITA